MGKFVTHRDNSRINWGRDTDDGQNNRVEDIQLGCLLRIADGVEAMAKNITGMERDLKYYKGRFEREQETSVRLAHSNAALRGVIRRLKKLGSEPINDAPKVTVREGK